MTHMTRPVWGLAELHAHTMSYLAFGGALWGTPDSVQYRYDWQNQRFVTIPVPGIEDEPIGSQRRLALSLPSCDGNHHARLYLQPDNPVNGPRVGLGVDQTLGAENLTKALEGGIHRGMGYPDFTTWPVYSSQLHQQMYIEWIYRAFQGGLRLMVTHAVDSYVLRRVRAYAPDALTLLLPFPAAHGNLGRDDRPQATIGDLTPRGALFSLAIREQITGMTDLIARHGNSSAPVGTLQNFMALARSSAEAREIIEGGRLAIVLGVETANIIPLWAELPEAYRLIDELYELGVRHIFPIHHIDNWFGGAAIIAAGENEDLVNSENEFVTNNFWLVTDGSNADARDDPRGELPPEGLYFKLKSRQRRLTFRGGNYWDLIRLAGDAAGLGRSAAMDIYSEEVDRSAQYDRWPSHMNVLGLSPLGRLGIRKLMSKGMVIDIDHMSSLSFSDTMDIAESITLSNGNEVTERGYPVVSSHSKFRALFPRKPRDMSNLTSNESPDRSKWTDEWSISRRMMRRILRVGGMVTVFISGQVTLPWSLGNTRIDPDPIEGPSSNRPATTRSIAQKLLYAIDIMRQEGAAEQGIGLGTDFNGLAAKPGPRVGNLVDGVFFSPPRWNYRLPYNLARTPAEIARDEGGGYFKPINYDRLPSYARYHRRFPTENSPALQLSTAGNRGFDYNVLGLSHYGLIPDMLQDLKILGITDEQLNPLFQGAEKYIQVWEKCERMKASPDLRI